VSFGLRENGGLKNEKAVKTSATRTVLEIWFSLVTDSP